MGFMVKSRELERCPSGLRSTLGKRVGSQGSRRFESCSLRQNAAREGCFLLFFEIDVAALVEGEVFVDGFLGDFTGLRHALALPKRIDVAQLDRLVAIEDVLWWGSGDFESLGLAPSVEVGFASGVFDEFDDVRFFLVEEVFYGELAVIFQSLQNVSDEEHGVSSFLTAVDDGKATCGLDKFAGDGFGLEAEFDDAGFVLLNFDVVIDFANIIEG